MSTHAIIGSEHSNEKGRYLNYDGYPCSAGVELIKIIKRDGAEKAIAELTEKHYSWSWIESNLDEEKFKNETKNYADPERFGFAEGYGAFYCLEEEAAPDDWSKITSEPFGYIINKNGTIDVYAYGEKVGTIDTNDDDGVEKMKALEEE